MLELRQIESFYPESLRPFKRNLLREYLQYKVLEAVFAHPYGEKLAFLGGTAIHIIYGNTRFSEDLDFDNLDLSKRDFEQLAKLIQKKLALEGYAAEIKTSFQAAWRASLRITDILYESGLSKHKQEKVLIQIDAQPQGFNYQPDKPIINKFDVFTRINAVPIDILLAQKIYTIFMRRRPMGRDFYDAIFLFGKSKPNYGYLNAKLKINNWGALKERLLERCSKLKFKQLAKDTEQFLFVPADAKKVLLFEAYLKGL